jgi:hypothetical protein
VLGYGRVTDPVMALGLLLNLYRDREMCVTMAHVGAFPYLTHTSCFSSVIMMLWARGCTGLPSPGVEAPDAGAHG